MKTWTKPTIEVVNMNAEIGGYQPDFDDGPDAVKRGQAPPSPAEARGQPVAAAADAADLPTPGQKS